MIIDIVFYGSIAYLVAMMLWRFIFAGMAKGGRTREGGATALARRVLGRGWVVFRVVLVLALASCAVKYDLGPFNPWSDQERAELSHFVDAVNFYDEATGLYMNKEKLTNEDWESVSAMLQAALAEGEQVRPELLKKLHPELDQQFQKLFIAGLHAGTYGLHYYTSRSKSESDSVIQSSGDSLEIGRGLLGKWNDWFKTERDQILDDID
jgi:hypothetical protein